MRTHAMLCLLALGMALPASGAVSTEDLLPDLPPLPTAELLDDALPTHESRPAPVDGVRAPTPGLRGQMTVLGETLGLLPLDWFEARTERDPHDLARRLARAPIEGVADLPEPPTADHATQNAWHPARDAPRQHEPGTQPAGADQAPVETSTLTRIEEPPRNLATHARLGATLLALLLAPFLLYHRLQGPRVLEQDTRARIFELTNAQPGITPTEVARVLQIDPTTARYHLQRLIREELVTAEGARHFAAGSLPSDGRRARVAAERSRTILEAVLGSPGSTKSQLAERTGLSRPTVTWHLERLAQFGLVQMQRVGRAVRVQPDAAGLSRAGLL